jgi:DNA-binding response OmpR family regulator
LSEWISLEQPQCAAAGKDKVPNQALVLLVQGGEILIAELLGIALSRAGYEVHRANTAEIAIAELKGEKQFSALIVDLDCLPGDMSGWEIAHCARGLDPGVAVIYTGGGPDHEHQAKGVPGGTFLQKPYVPDQITTAILTLLNERPQ